MAAAEYFSNAPMHTSATPPIYHQAPTSQPQQVPYSNQNHSNLSVPQMQLQRPPSYQDNKPGVHFAPSPTELHQRHSFSHQQRPSQNSWNNHHQSNYSQTQIQHRPPQGYGTPPSTGYTPPQKPQYLHPHMRPYMHPESGTNAEGYASDPEPDRRRHKQRRRRDSGEKRSGSTKPRSNSRSTNSDAFLGAAGGGLIGDLIFPGLGTVGGAALGWFGGKDYGHHRKEREEKRAGEQREWERKYGRQRSRSGSHDSR